MTTEAEQGTNGGGVATSADTLTVTDNRTGKQYEIPIEDDTIRATELRKIKTHDDDFGSDDLRPRPTWPRRRAARRSPTSTATRASWSTAATRSSSWPRSPAILEVAYLLIHGELPTQEQLDEWDAPDHDPHVRARERQGVHAGLPLRRPPDGHAAGLRRRAVDVLPRGRRRSRTPDIRYIQVIRLIAKMPTLAAFSFRHNRACRTSIRTTTSATPGNFLSMIYKMTELKYEPDPRLEHALDVLFILHADHEQNCSTSAVRSVGSSQVDPYSAVAAGVGGALRPAARRRQRGGAADAAPHRDARRTSRTSSRGSRTATRS